MNRLTLSAVLLLLACSGKDKDTGNTDTDADTDTDTDADSDTDTDTDTDTDCVATVVSVDPEDGRENIPVSTPVEVTFDAAVTAADVSITSDDGTGSVSIAGDGMSATFTPDSDWPEESSVTVDIEVCGNSSSTTFTTLPAPIDPALVEGNTYSVSWNDVVITEPAAGAALKLLLPVEEIVLQVTSISGDDAPTIATLAFYQGVDLVPECTLALRQTADFSENPLYQFAGDLQIVIDTDTGATADVEDFSLLGRVTTDGQSMQGVRITAMVAPEQFLDGGDCNSFLVQGLLGNPTCVPCTISGTGECLAIEMEAPSAPVIPGYDLSTLCP
jgi:hypothetical protein